MTLRGAIDIGTNSVRLLVADLAARPPRSIVSRIAITGLGEGLDGSGRIAETAMSRTEAAIETFAREARVVGAEEIRCFGTLALREASNGTEVAARLERAASASVRVISGDEEAATTWRGLRVGHEAGAGDLLLDIGGGSTEFTFGAQDGGVLFSRSLALGSVRQTERWGADVEGMRGEIRARVAEGVARPADAAPIRRLFGVAGSVTQVVALELELDPYDPARVDGHLLSHDVVTSWVARLSAMDVGTRARLRGMGPARAGPIVAGAMILQETIRALGLGGVVASEYDSLWGALVS